MVAVSDIYKYDFHLHTNFVHAIPTVAEVAAKAQELGLQAIAITEHVRKDLTYNFSNLLDEIEAARKEFKVKILVGCEAKILDREGTLDGPADVFERVDFIIGSVHRLPEGCTREDCFWGLLQSPCHVLGHPVDFPLDWVPQIKIQDKFLELNGSYPLSGDLVQRALQEGVSLSIGSDAHRVDAIAQFSWIEALSKEYPKELSVNSFIERFL